jgi:hypothetical protein
MERRRILEIIIFGLWLMIAVVLVMDQNFDTNATIPIPEELKVDKNLSGNKYNIKRISVLNGDSFDIVLKDQKSTRILGKLNVNATQNAKQEVLELLNHVTNPKVVLESKQVDGKWIVNIYFTQDGKEKTITEWLVSKNLVYQ